MQKWEYTAVVSETPLQSRLNVFGDDGWELVSAFYDSQYGYVYYFKRPKAEQPPNLPPIRS